MDVMSTSNKRLLGLERWEELFKSGDESAIKTEMTGLQAAVQDIQEVIYAFNLE